MAKKNKNQNQQCPCGSSMSYQQCCQPYHLGKAAPDAEKLMRSRYSAFALKLKDYLLQSWAEETRPQNIEFEDDIKWIGLKVLDHQTMADDQATVHFIATFKQNGRAQKLEEVSLFRKENNRWYYIKAKGAV